jgi:hypothetical protein
VSFAIEPTGLDLIRFRTGQDFRRYITPGWFSCTVFDSQDDVLAACVGEWKSLFEVDFTAAIDNPRAISRKLLRVIFGTLFQRAIRVVARVEPDNDHSADVVRRLGFQYAGFLRKGLDGDRDAYIFDMLREDCRWLPGYSGGTIIRSDFAGEPYHGQLS